MKLKNLLASTLLAASVAAIPCCHAMREISPRSETLAKERIMTTVLLRGDTVRFDADGARFLRGDSLIVGRTREGNVDSVHADSVRAVFVERMNAPLTLLAVLGVLLLASLTIILIAMGQARPF